MTILDALKNKLGAHLTMMSLRAKLQVAISLLMVSVLIFTALTFLVSTRVTERQILRAQAASDTAKVVDALNTRVASLNVTANTLAQDPTVVDMLNSNTEEGLQALNARALAVRDRYDLGLIQIYDIRGIARTNLLLASLYRESSLLNQINQDSTVVREIEGRIVLLSRVDLAEGWGSVITGIDLEREIREIASHYRMTTDIGIEFRGTTTSSADAVLHRISTTDSDDFPYEGRLGRRDIYAERTTIQLGEDNVDVILALSTQNTQRLTATGLLVTLLSLGATTAVLLFGSLTLMKAFAMPVHELSEAVNAVAQGDLQRRATNISTSFLKIGQNDEIGTLTESFNRMVVQLQDLYENLETRVDERTHQLATAAEVARTVASSLDLGVMLHKACEVIRQRLGANTVAAYIVDVENNIATLEHVSGGGYPLNRGDEVMLNSNTTIGMTAQQHSPCLIADTVMNTRYLPTTWSTQVRSVLTAPILQGSDAIGVLDLQSIKPNHFTHEAANLLNTLSDQMALGIQNAQRYAEELRRRRFTEVLELTGRILSGSRNLHELPARALSSLHALVNYERGSLWMVQGSRLVPLAQYGYADERPLLRQHVKTDTEIYAKLATERRPLIINNLEVEPKWHSEKSSARQQLWLRGDRAWMGVPIVTTNGEVIGIVCLASSDTGAFDADDAIWVQAFASQASIALENARLYAQMDLSDRENNSANSTSASADSTMFPLSHAPQHEPQHIGRLDQNSHDHHTQKQAKRRSK